MVTLHPLPLTIWSALPSRQEDCHSVSLYGSLLRSTEWLGHWISETITAIYFKPSCGMLKRFCGSKAIFNAVNKLDVYKELLAMQQVRPKGCHHGAGRIHYQEDERSER